VTDAVQRKHMIPHAMTKNHRNTTCFLVTALSNQH